MKLVLASASPRRAELLRQMGLTFEIKAVDIDEIPFFNELPRDYVKRLAIGKARAAKKLCKETKQWVIGSDTSVILDNDIFGKPNNKQHAIEMLSQLSGKTHTVLTSVAVLAEEEQCVVSESKVTFAGLSDEDLESYWNSGEPQGKAGAYAIQGKGAVFIKNLEGSFSGVMGLPIYETQQLLKRANFYSSR